MITLIALLLNIALAIYIYTKDPVKMIAILVGFAGAFAIIGLVNIIDWAIRRAHRNPNN